MAGGRHEKVPRHVLQAGQQVRWGWQHARLHGELGRGRAAESSRVGAGTERQPVGARPRGVARGSQLSHSGAGGIHRAPPQTPPDRPAGRWAERGFSYQTDDSSTDPVPHELSLPSSPKPQVARQSLCRFVSSTEPGLTALAPSEMPPPSPVSRHSRLPAAPSGPASYLPNARRVLVSIPRAALCPSRTPMRTTLEAAPGGPTAPPRCAQCAAGPGAPFWRARVREESRRVGDFRSRCRPRQIRMQRLLLEPREASHGGLRAASWGPAAGGCLGAQHHISAVGPFLSCRC